jgi:hypothetical protein
MNKTKYLLLNTGRYCRLGYRVDRILPSGGGIFLIKYRFCPDIREYYSFKVYPLPYILVLLFFMAGFYIVSLKRSRLQEFFYSLAVTLPGSLIYIYDTYHQWINNR